MVNFCAVIGCGNRGGRNKKRFFSLPAIITNQGEQTKQLSERRQREWLAAIARSDIKQSNYKYTRVCGDHFISGTPAKLYESTKPDWVPTVNMGYDSTTLMSPPATRQQRHRRTTEREEKKRRWSAAFTLIDLNQQQTLEPPVDAEVMGRGKRGLPCQTDMTSSVIEDMEQQITDQAENLNCASEKLKKCEAQISNYSVTPQSFKDDDEKVKFYTGLPNYATLMALFSLVEEHLSGSANQAMTIFQQLIMTITKLRLNLSHQDLSYRYGVSKSTVARVFTNTIDVLASRLANLIYWPEREPLRKSMPMDFRKHFGTKVAVIIDCFEVFTEQPSSQDNKIDLWSSYKHHHTVKFLIGVTPQGVICYISDSWGGRTSDKYLTEHSGFLQKLLPGDLVLADRGFNVEESVGLMCAQVVLPAFMRGRKQLSALDVENTRKVANLRIHVERVIGMVRQKYTILQDTLPIDFLKNRGNDQPIIDKIALVSCALCNLCPSIVPFN